MLRVVLAVVLAVALLAAALPAVERARVARAESAARTTTLRFVDAVERLDRANDAVPLDGPGARRVFEIRVPERGPATAGLEAIAIGGTTAGDGRGDGPDSDVIAYRVRGGRNRVARLPAVDLRVVRDGTVADDRTPLVLRGDARLVLRLATIGGHRVVLVGRCCDARLLADGPNRDGRLDEPPGRD